MKCIKFHCFQYDCECSDTQQDTHTHPHTHTVKGKALITAFTTVVTAVTVAAIKRQGGGIFWKRMPINTLKKLHKSNKLQILGVRVLLVSIVMLLPKERAKFESENEEKFVTS